MAWAELTRNPQGNASIAVDVNGVLHHFGGTGVSRLNSNGTYTDDDHTSTSGWLESSSAWYGCGAHDKATDKTIIVSSGILDVWEVRDINDALQLHPTWTGDTEIVGASKSGIAYSDYTQTTYIYNQSVNANAIYSVDPINFIVTKHDVAGAVEPIDMTNQGVYRRFWAMGDKLYLLTSPNGFYEIGL